MCAKNIDQEKLYDLYINKKLTIEEVSNSLSANSITVRKYMKKYGIKARDVNFEQSLLNRLGISESDFHEILKDKYIDNSMSIMKIAKIYNVSTCIIRKYLIKFGISLRNHKESNSISNSGSKNPKWKGGYRIKEGYIQLLCPSHPAASGIGYVYEHRLVVEENIGRYLITDEHIHHINGIKTDNRIENLQILSNSDHVKLHHKIKKSS